MLKKLYMAVYSFAEHADWYNYPPKKFWRSLLNWFDKRNPVNIATKAYVDSLCEETCEGE